MTANLEVEEDVDFSFDTASVVNSVRFAINLCLLPARLSWSCTKSSMKYFVYLPVMFMLKRYEPELEQKISNRKKKIKKLTSDIATPLLCSLRTLILR